MSIGKSATGKVKITDGNVDASLRDLANANSVDVSIVDANGDQLTSFPISDGGGSITVDGTVTANAGTGTFAVSAASLPLPTGAATSALQTTGNASLTTIASAIYTEGDIDTSISGVAILGEEVATSTLKTISSKQLGTQVTSADNGLITNSVIHGLSSAGGGSFVDVKVNPSGSLEVNANQGTHDNLNANANIQVGNTDVGNANPVPVSDAGGSLTIDGTVTANAGTGTFAVSAATLPLPTGAATESTLSTLNGKIPSNLTVTSTRLLVDGSGVTQPVSGTVTVNQPVAVTDNSGSLTVDNAGTFAVQAAQSGTWILGANSGIDIGDVTINNASGASAVNIQDGGNSITVDGTVAATQSGTWNTRVQDSSGTGITSTLNSGKQSLDVNVTSAISVGVADKTSFTYGTTAELPIGGVYQDTSPTLTAGTTGAARLTQYRAFHFNLRDSSGNELLGQKAMTSSVPVVVSSDQSNLPTDVKGAAAIVSVTPTISTSAYTADDQIGGLQTISSAVRTSGGTATLHSITILDKAKQNADIDLYFFDQSVTVASSDNAALDISDSEMASKCIGVVKIRGSDYSNLSANSVVTSRNVGLTLDATGSTSLYSIAKIGATATYGSTSDLVFKYHFLQD